MSPVFAKWFPAAAASLAAAALLGAFGLNAAHAQGGAPSSADIATLKAEIESLRRALPGHAHVMAELDYHFSNLWFAAKNGNWPLAAFYLNETRSNLNWMIRIRPTRRLANGQDLDLTPVVKAVEDTALANLHETVDKQDGKAFETAYRQTIEQCYACHKLAEKPFLRPMIPEAPASRMINPHAQAASPQ